MYFLGSEQLFMKRASKQASYLAGNLNNRAPSMLYQGNNLVSSSKEINEVL